MKEKSLLAWAVRRKVVVMALGALAFCGVAVGADAVSVEPIAMQGAKVDGFWHDQYRRLACRWIPHCIRQMEAGGAGEELLNLVATGEVLAGKTPSVKFKGCPWSDAYVYNTMEAISLALEIDPDDDFTLAQGQQAIRAKMEEWIPIILSAQEPSGYIHSFHDLRKKPHFTRASDHEFYVMGYFIEMGVAHFRMTKGKTDASSTPRSGAPTTSTRYSALRRSARGSTDTPALNTRSAVSPTR